MKGSRFSEEQIIGTLRDFARTLKRARRRRIYAGGAGSRRRPLRVESRVRWVEGLGGTTAEGAGGREPAAQEAAGRSDTGQRGAQGHSRKKTAEARGGRVTVGPLMEGHRLSQRRAPCRLADIGHSTPRCQWPGPTTRPCCKRRPLCSAGRQIHVQAEPGQSNRRNRVSVRAHAANQIDIRCHPATRDHSPAPFTSVIAAVEAAAPNGLHCDQTAPVLPLPPHDECALCH